MSKIESGVYIISFKGCPLVYVWSSYNLNQRKRSHLNHLKKLKHYNKKMQNAYNTFGLDNFVFNVVLYCENEDNKIR